MSGGLFVEVWSNEIQIFRTDTWAVESVELAGPEELRKFRHTLTAIAPDVADPVLAPEIEVLFGFDSSTAEHVDFCRVVSFSRRPHGWLLVFDGPVLDTLALRLIDNFLRGEDARWDWRDFRDPAALKSWQVACVVLRFSGWRDRLTASARLDLVTTTWTDYESVFCILGEQLNGRFGYAGRDPIGFAEILTEEIRHGRRVELLLPSTGSVSLSDGLTDLLSDLGDTARECGAIVKVVAP
jgi:hypothetical protein